MAALHTPAFTAVLQGDNCQLRENPVPADVHIVHAPHLCVAEYLRLCPVTLQTKVRKEFTIIEKAPTWAFSWLKAPTSTGIVSFKTLL